MPESETGKLIGYGVGGLTLGGAFVAWLKRSFNLRRDVDDNIRRHNSNDEKHAAIEEKLDEINTSIHENTDKLSTEIHKIGVEVARLQGPS